MKILVVSKGASRDDRGEWSGTVYQAIRGLERAGFEVDYLCGLRDSSHTLLDKLLCRYWLTVPGRFGRLTRMDETFHSVRVYSHTLHHFDFSPYDVIFVPTHISIVNALPRHLRAKVVHLVDATVDSLFGYYQEFSNLWFHNYWEAHTLGRRAFRRSDLIVASSDWCRDNAVADYGVDPGRIAVVEFGANIDEADCRPVPRREPTGRPINVYWSGVNWERKGGDVAVECCRCLRALGRDVRLNLTGMRSLPADVAAVPWVVNHGFLDKNAPEQYRRLVDIMADQDIFLFPSRAECSSIALCEANAFALPCFVYATGGTANYVADGDNGRMLPLSASGYDFARAIDEMLADGLYERMSAAAALRYRSRLNWATWSDKVSSAITSLCDQ